MICRIHRTLLLGWAPAFCIVAWVVCLGFRLVLWAGSGLFPEWNPTAEWYSEFSRTTRGILVFAAGVAGILRALIFHPRLQAKYTRWLRATCWSPEKPLPLGPVYLSWQDALAVALLSIFTWTQLGGRPAHILLAFLLCYSAAVFCLLLGAGEKPGVAPCGAILFLAPAGLIRFYANPAVFWALIVPIGATAMLGSRVSLRGFPWGQDKPPTPAEGDPTGAGPRKFAEPCDAVSAFGPAAMLGWWLYALTYALESADALQADCWPFVGLIAVAFAGVRYWVYRSRQQPPLSLLGRLITGRLVIPRYDIIWVAPFACLAVGGLGMASIVYDRLPAHWSWTLSICALIWASAGIGPNLNDWRLTSVSHIRVTQWREDLTPTMRRGNAVRQQARVQ